MNKTIQRCIFVVALGVWAALSFAAPWVLCDGKNGFLKGFVNHELLGVLGVILAITLASAGNIHLTLNTLEEAAGKIFLMATRQAVKSSAYSLIFVFGLAVLLVTIKPHVGDSETATSLVNGFALILLLVNILVLTDLTQLVFRIGPMMKK